MNEQIKEPIQSCKKCRDRDNCIRYGWFHSPVDKEKYNALVERFGCHRFILSTD